MTQTENSEPKGTIRERIQSLQVGLTKTEHRIVGTILADYPISALKTLVELGKLSGASPATLLRFVAKLGFSGYPEFQKSLREELQSISDSPLGRYQGGGTVDVGTTAPLPGYGQYAAELLQETVDMVPPQVFEAVVDLLAEERRPVWLIGGRYSRGLVSLMGYGLTAVRGHVREVDSEARGMVNALADIGRRDVVVVFDFRRYQRNLCDFAELAVEAGARLVVFTDRWHSPCARFATQVVALPVASPSLFDTGLSTLFCIEAMIKHLSERLDPQAPERIARMELLYRSLNEQPQG